ncbi:acyl carrier protein [Candidatus Scalindua japonica]|uniref:Acyl carrier protein n=1 Tax=Candidatus Scalindua japonica TaxID=1284222 RepID=A0A286TTF1_9BACT|nr:phosphopantetheine-binding protein [Candidatus Scalindua japonica]GAX59148.1 acyl carrier protein [Candidatus Scalindua japonica]
MTREDIFNIIKENIIKVLIDIDSDSISIDQSLKDLGANSIDRVEIAQDSMEDLNLVLPRVDLGQAQNINDLVNIFYKHINS